MSYVDAVVGLQRGDEAKGKYFDILMAEYDIGLRFGGGPNAGHTVVMQDGEIFKLHTIPSGITHQDKIMVLADGVFVDAAKVDDEMTGLRQRGVEISPDNFKISSSAHLILPHHILREKIAEAGSGRQDTTLSGMRFVGADFGERTGVRAEMINNNPDELGDRIYEGLVRYGSRWTKIKDRLGIKPRKEKDAAFRYVEQAFRLGEHITDTMIMLNDALDDGQTILAEGAQGFQLDPYQGQYPYVTSSITTSGGITPGAGIETHRIRNVLGVAKAFQSHVGGGHFVTEFDDPEIIAALHGNLDAPDAEFGVTTGRVRRLGALDIPLIRRANLANGTTEMALSKLDWLSRLDVIPVCVDHVRKDKVLDRAPNANYKLVQTEPVTVHLPGWNEDISGVRRFEDLPRNAQALVEFVEEKVQKHIRYVGVGQRRDEIIERQQPLAA